MNTGNNHCKRCGRVLSLFDIDVCKMCAEQMNKPFLIKETPNPTDRKVLEQIRAEIVQLYTIDTVYEDVVAVDKVDVLQIIDKYKGDKE